MEGQEQEVGSQLLFRRVVKISGAEHEFLRVERIARGNRAKLRAVLMGEFTLEFPFHSRGMIAGELNFLATPINWDRNGCICIEIADRGRKNVVTLSVYHDAAKASDIERVDLQGNHLGPWDQAAPSSKEAAEARRRREASECAIALAILAGRL